MAITKIDMDLFKELPNNEWITKYSIDIRGAENRLERMVKNGLLKKGDAPNEHCFMKNNITNECCKCGALFHQDQYVRVPNNEYGIKAWDMTCPKCGNKEFYDLRQN